jgi:hypothetical protein
LTLPSGGAKQGLVEPLSCFSLWHDRGDPKQGRCDRVEIPGYATSALGQNRPIDALRCTAWHVRYNPQPRKVRRTWKADVLCQVRPNATQQNVACSITSLAVASTLGGMLRPSSLVCGFLTPQNPKWSDGSRSDAAVLIFDVSFTPLKQTSASTSRTSASGHKPTWRH